MSSCTLDADDKNALWDDRHRAAINCTEFLCRTDDIDLLTDHSEVSVCRMLSFWASF
jgi:hypothetical protein